MKINDFIALNYSCHPTLDPWFSFPTQLLTTRVFTYYLQSHKKFDLLCFLPDELTVKFNGVLISWLLVSPAVIPWRPAASDATCGRFCKFAKFWRFWSVTMPATTHKFSIVWEQCPSRSYESMKFVKKLVRTYLFRLDELARPPHVSLDEDFQVTGSVVSFVNSLCHLSSFGVRGAYYHLSPVRDFQRYSCRYPVTDIYNHMYDRYIITCQIEIQSPSIYTRANNNREKYRWIDLYNCSITI